MYEMTPRRRHGLRASRLGAGHADAGRDSSGNQRGDFVVRGGGHSADDAAESAALARAVRAVGVQRPGRPASLSVEATGAAGRARARAPVVSGAVRGIQWAAFPRDRSPRAWRHPVVQLYETGAPAGGLTADAQTARSALPTPRTARLLWRAAAPGWQSPSLAGAGAGGARHAHHRRR